MLRRRSPSALVAVLVAVLALVAVGCGVDGKSDSGGGATTVAEDSATSTTTGGSDTTTSSTTEDESTTTTDDSTDTTSGSSTDGLDQARDQVVELYMDMGLSEDQATCLADKILNSGITDSSDVDPSEAMGWFGDCDISISDLDMGG